LPLRYTVSKSEHCRGGVPPIQQARIVVGATVLVIGVSAAVFVIGALTGAGIAAWMMPSA
jgi:hypothetical protein